MIVIGTDPAFRNKGMAVFIYDTDTKDAETRIFKDLRDFQKWIDGLSDEKPPINAIVGIEDSDKQQEVFEKSFQNFLKNAKLQDNRGTRNKYAFSVGKNMAATQYAIRLFSEKYKPRNVFSITPGEKGRKMTAREFEMNYGIKTIDYEQDEIDAGVIAMIAIQRHKFYLKIKEAKKIEKSKMKSKILIQKD